MHNCSHLSRRSVENLTDFLSFIVSKKGNSTYANAYAIILASQKEVLAGELKVNQLRLKELNHSIN